MSSAANVNEGQLPVSDASRLRTSPSALLHAEWLLQVILLGPMQLEEKPLVVTSGLVTASELLKLMDRGLEEWHTAFRRRGALQPAEDLQQASEAAKRQQQAGQQQNQQPSCSAGAAALAQQQQPGGKAAASSSASAQRSAAAADQDEAHEPARGTAQSRLACLLWPGLIRCCPGILTAPLPGGPGRA